MNLETAMAIIERGGNTAVALICAWGWWQSRKDTERERAERHEKEAIFRDATGLMSERIGKMGEALLLIKERIR